ncbi:MAG TPA: T7SS effector LXG polymorphic toxin [Candidatus Avamphibacillus sp.]|nr:T7SS effector LXG polymorphic toxin [Candidatus Avamphibacillus sp.]
MRHGKASDEANSIIDSVSDIVSITQIDESNLVNDVNRGKEDAEDIVEKLHELDKSQVDAMESVKEDLHTMKNYVTELETMFKDGDLSVGDYSVKAVSGLESFRDILESIYNERDIYAIILGKLQRGGILTNVEKAELYDYFQSIIDDETRKEIEEIASLINEKDIDKLKERLNEEVILSIDALEEEIAMVQAYIYIWGDKTPNDLDIERENKQKLEAYLILLQSYYFALGKWGDPVAQINQLKYKENPQGLSGHYLQSDIQTDEYRPNIKDKMNKDEFRELIFSSDNHFDPDGSIVVNLDKIEITYFSKANASNLSDFLETEGLLKKNANYTRDFIIDQSLSKIFSLLGNQISNTKLVYDYLAGKQNLEKQITIEEAKNTAAFLGMEFSISNNHTTNGDGYGIEVKLYPTETTFKALERWEEVHNDDPSIPYPPEDAIKTQDWHKISKFLYKYNTSIDDDVFDFITYGT